jgi:hypothetical protein
VPAERQGSRWLYAMPSEDDLKEWFRTQHLHDGMQHEPYMGGIVVIGAKEKYAATMAKQDGTTYVRENMERMVYVPYVKVDTRIAYFWDLVRALNGGKIMGDYVGVISPVSQRRIEDPSSPYFNLHLPEGFFRLPLPNKDGSFNNYIGCTQRVAIYGSEDYLNSENPKPLIQGIGTKQTVAGKTYADDNALMKAETSAVGRALGLAGILVVGTGVASAEDMQEVQAGEAGAAAARQPTLPPVVGPQVETAQAAPPSEAPSAAEPTTPEQERELMLERIQVLTSELQSASEEQWELTKAAVLETTKGAAIHSLPVPAIKGILIRLERDLDQVKAL